jgi:flagellar hook-associated protein 2
MGELRLPGLATGIDTAALIEQLMAVNSRRLATYQIQKMDYEEETTALNELQAKVNELNSAVTAISNASTLEAYKASTSDGDVLGVSASEDAAEGSHSILIDQLATSETWIQDTSTFDYETDYVGGGTFIYSYNHQERQITAVANETTLEDLVGLINNDEENPGVTASLLYQGGKYHLMLSGQHTGEDYQISLNGWFIYRRRAKCCAIHQNHRARPIHRHTRSRRQCVYPNHRRESFWHRHLAQFGSYHYSKYNDGPSYRIYQSTF